MRIYGNLTNRIQENVKSIPDEVGMGATILMHSDRRACTVVAIHKNKARKINKVEVTKDKAIRTDNNGMSESQSYTYETVPNAPTEVFTLRRNGTWVKEDEDTQNGTRIVFGYRDEFYDFTM